MKKNILLTLIIVSGVLNMALAQTTVTYPTGPLATFFDGNLIEADYWSEEPKILSAGLGFCDIVGIPAPMITEEIDAAGLSWETDSSPYDENGGPRLVGAKLNYVDEGPAGEGVSQ